MHAVRERALGNLHQPILSLVALDTGLPSSNASTVASA